MHFIFLTVAMPTTVHMHVLLTTKLKAPINTAATRKATLPSVEPPIAIISK